MDENRRVTSRTFRQTLSNLSSQNRFLIRCHRSYLVNPNTVKEISGNSQSAKISFIYGEEKVPLSKTYYKEVKASLL